MPKNKRRRKENLPCTPLHLGVPATLSWESACPKSFLESALGPQHQTAGSSRSRAAGQKQEVKSSRQPHRIAVLFQAYACHFLGKDEEQYRSRGCNATLQKAPVHLEAGRAQLAGSLASSGSAHFASPSCVLASQSMTRLLRCCAAVIDMSGARAV